MALQISLSRGYELRNNLMAGRTTRSKSWTDYEGLPIPPCGDYYKRRTSHSLILPWLYRYTVVTQNDKRVLQKRKAFSDHMSLHDEISAFVEYMKPTKREIEILQNLVDRFTRLLSSFNVDASTPEPVGSYVTGLFLPTSDIDMVIIPRPLAREKDVLRQIYHKLLLMPPPQFHKELKDVLNATVPLITITDAKTGISIDLSAAAAHSRAATRAVSEWLKRDPSLGDEGIIRMLVTIVKSFLSIRRCGTTYTGGINSYVLVWMVVAWVKLELPRLRQKRKAETLLSSDIDLITSELSSMGLGVTARLREASAFPDYGDILIAFFKFYGEEFDYRSTKIIISPEPRYTSKFDISQPYLLSIMDPAGIAIDMGSKAYAIKHIAESFKEAHVQLKQLEDRRLAGSSVGNEGILGKVLGGDFWQFWLDRYKLDSSHV